MRNHTLNRRATLQQYRRETGHAGEDTLIKEKDVRVNVQRCGLHLKSTMAAIGRGADCSVLLYRREFEDADYTHIVIDGTVYRIEDDAHEGDGLYVSLVCARD